jgi:hypothetical protein
MVKATQLLSVLARINPAIFDVIFPHGPVLAHAFASRLSQVALNPQPLPPEPPPERLQRASALVAHNIAFAAITAEAAGQDGGVRVVNSAIDDWCGNGRPPIPIPWPGPWPFAFALDAVPKDLDVATSRLVGALSFAAVAQRMDTGKVREALSDLKTLVNLAAEVMADEKPADRHQLHRLLSDLTRGAGHNPILSRSM